MRRNKSKRRNKTKATSKKRKPVYSKRNIKRTGGDPGTAAPMEKVIGTIEDQIMNVEIKLAVQQYLINETIDEWQRKGWLNESEVKSLYERTYQYWKNDLKEQGSPFAELDLMKRPALELYKSHIKNTAAAEPVNPGPPQPHVMNPRREEDAELLHQIKEELKERKREFLKQRLEEIKRTLK
ncbi:hypothetical protein [Paenibacillus sp. Soil522]|uniref:hypothetical protein n=1 Tax=Paenibacillus sp. Soil522 TaxID=1736388 RepID=UPI0006F3F249|nr:hypothetical protein [Paenibacillus sp. Soil522]KRE32643.1 hypothetical protein ASG81_24250 [Paenibacillus sp. Soil522]